MKWCPQCGYANSDRATICTGCNADLRRVANVTKWCAGCGCANRGESLFCDNCGADISQADLETQRVVRDVPWFPFGAWAVGMVVFFTLVTQQANTSTALHALAFIALGVPWVVSLLWVKDDVRRQGFSEGQAWRMMALVLLLGWMGLVMYLFHRRWWTVR